MEERINLVTVPFDMEMAKEITRGKILGEIQMNSPYWTKDCRIICFDLKGVYPIVALGKGDSDGNEFLETFQSNGENGVNKKLQLRIPELLTYKEGDIVYCENQSRDIRWISIVQEAWTEGLLGFNEYVAYFIDSRVNELEYDGYSDNIGFTRMATEEEKQQLVEALKADDCEESKKILKQFFNIEEDENVTESKQDSECKFQPFDKVLVRDDKQGIWRIEFFGFTLDDEDFKYRCLYDSYRYCIPYNENTKHLLGTTDNWEEEQ